MKQKNKGCTRLAMVVVLLIAFFATPSLWQLLNLEEGTTVMFTIITWLVLTALGLAGWNLTED